jgi:hypothetical protein
MTSTDAGVCSNGKSKRVALVAIAFRFGLGTPGATWGTNDALIAPAGIRPPNSDWLIGAVGACAGTGCCATRGVGPGRLTAAGGGLAGALGARGFSRTGSTVGVLPAGRWRVVGDSIVTGGSFGFVAPGVVVAGAVVSGVDVVEGVDVAGAGGEFGGGVSWATAAPHAESHEATRTVELRRCERRPHSRSFPTET